MCPYVVGWVYFGEKYNMKSNAKSLNKYFPLPIGVWIFYIWLVYSIWKKYECLEYLNLYVHRRAPQEHLSFSAPRTTLKYCCDACEEIADITMKCAPIKSFAFRARASRHQWRSIRGNVNVCELKDLTVYLNDWQLNSFVSQHEIN
jgi:hypothetical protein